MRIRTDHLLHFETCALIAVVAGLVLPWWAASLIALGIGVGATEDVCGATVIVIVWLLPDEFFDFDIPCFERDW